jgi:hypothetical protein
VTTALRTPAALVRAVPPEEVAVAERPVILGAGEGAAVKALADETASSPADEAAIPDRDPTAGVGTVRRTPAPLLPAGAGADAVALLLREPDEYGLLFPLGHDVLEDLPASLYLARPGALESVFERLADWVGSGTVREWLPWLSGVALAAAALGITHGQLRRSVSKGKLPLQEQP